MIIYLLVLLLLLLLTIRYDVLEKKFAYRFAYILLYVIFVLVAGLRYKVGSDTINYMIGFDNRTYPSLQKMFYFGLGDSRYDPLWIIFVSFCRSISNDYFFMQFIHALVINAVFFYIIFKYSYSRFFTLLLYYIFGYIFFNTEIMRESLAVAVFLLSLHFFYHKKWIYYYLVAGIAVLFHSSALVVFIFPFFHRLKFNKWFIISFIGVIFSSSIIWTIFSEQIELLFFISSVQDKARAYIDNMENYQMNLNGIIWGVFTYVFSPFLIVVFAKKYLKTDVQELPFVLLFLFVGIFLVYNQTIFTRLQNYLFFPFIIYVGNVVFLALRHKSRFEYRKLKLFIILFFLLFGKYYPYFKIEENYNVGYYFYERYVPYISILNKDDSVR